MVLLGLATKFCQEKRRNHVLAKASTFLGFALVAIQPLIMRQLGKGKPQRLLLPVNGWHKASDRNVWQRRRRSVRGGKAVLLQGQ